MMRTVTTQSGLASAQRRFAKIASSVIAMLVIGVPVPASAGNASPHVYGQTIGNWGQAWWQWALNFPAATNPILQDGAVDCSVGQSGKVWFLAGNFGGISERSCTVRVGRALFFPLLNGLAWMPEDCTTVGGCRQLVSEVLIDGEVNLTCTLDGVPCVFTHEIVRAQSDPRPINFPPGSIATDWGYAPGPRPASISDGYWVMLDPLSRGLHTLNITAKRGEFLLDVTYNLIVSP
jgi:hypothetical protein